MKIASGVEGRRFYHHATRTEVQWPRGEERQVIEVSDEAVQAMGPFLADAIKAGRVVVVEGELPSTPAKTVSKPRATRAAASRAKRKPSTKPTRAASAG